MNFSISSISWLAASGVLWDISGAVALVRGLALTPRSFFINQFRTYAIGNPSVLRDRIQSKHDTLFGLSHLLIGFLIQLISSLGINADQYFLIFSFALVIFLWPVHIFRSFHRTLGEVISIVLESEEALRSLYGIRSLRNKHLTEYSELDFEKVIWNEGYIDQLPTYPRNQSGTD